MYLFAVWYLEYFILLNFILLKISIAGIDDTTGAVTDVFQDKYFRIEEIGNFVAMVPGLVDVSRLYVFVTLTHKGKY